MLSRVEGTNEPTLRSQLRPTELEHGHPEHTGGSAAAEVPEQGFGAECLGRDASHGMQLSPPCLPVRSSVKCDPGCPEDLCPGTSARPCTGSHLCATLLGQSQEAAPPGTSSPAAWPEQPRVVAALLCPGWAQTPGSHMLMVLCSYFCFSVHEQRTWSQGRANPWSSLHLPPPRTPSSKVLNQVQRQLGEQCWYLMSTAKRVTFPLPCLLSRAVRFRDFILLRTSLHPLHRSSAGTNCSLQGLGEGMGWIFPERPPGMCRGAGTAGSVPPISGRARGCLRDSRSPVGGVRRQSGVGAVGSGGTGEWPGPRGSPRERSGPERDRHRDPAAPRPERPPGPEHTGTPEPPIFA